MNKGKFNLEALSLNIGDKSKLYLKNSDFDLKNKRVVLRNVVYANDERHPRFFSSLKYKTIWKDIRLDSLEILGFGFGDTVKHKQLSIDSITFFSPTILLKNKNSLPKNIDAEKIDFGSIIPHALDIHHIHVKDGKLEYRNYLKGVNKYKSITVDTINVHLNRKGYAYAEDNIFENSHPIGRGEIELKYFKSSLKYPHDLSIKRIAIDFDEDNVLVENIFLDNVLSAEKFIAKQAFKEDWAELRVNSVEVSGFNLQKYLDTDTLLISKVRVRDANLDTRNAGDLKRRPDRVGKLMHHWFSSLPGYHDVNDVKIINSRVKFRMYFEKATKSGLLDIKNITASVDRITNLDKSYVTHVNGKGSYLGNNNLSLYVRLKVYDKDFKYHVNASARNINLPDINTLIRPTKIIFLKGHMYLLQVEYDSENLSADAVGEVLFHYDNLKFEILKKDKKPKKSSSDLEEKDRENWLLSSAINMIAKTDNIPNKEGYVVGRFEMSRKSYQGFFGQLVGCMAKGAEVCLINKKDKAKIREEKRHKKEEKKKHRLERKKARESLMPNPK